MISSATTTKSHTALIIALVLIFLTILIIIGACLIIIKRKYLKEKLKIGRKSKNEFSSHEEKKFEIIGHQKLVEKYYEEESSKDAFDDEFSQKSN